MKAKKVIPISSCTGCPSMTLEYPSDEAEEKANSLKKEDFDNLYKYEIAKLNLMQSYCMENDEPPFQFVLRPIEDSGDIPDWCELPDAPDGLEQFFLKRVKF